MKQFRKITALLIALVMTLSLGVTAFADNSDVETGSIEVMNPQTGKDYTASKIFDVTYDGAKYAYTISADSPWLTTVQNYAAQTVTGGDTDPDGLTLEAVKNASGTPVAYNVTFDEDKFSAADFAKALREATVGTEEEDPAVDLSTISGVKKKTASATDETIKFEGLELGYWLVLPTTGALANLTTTDADVQIFDKNEQPEAKKIITSEDDDDNTISEAAVGDTIPFQLTTKVPDMTGYSRYFFVVKDTLSAGLEPIAKAASTDTTNTGFVIKLKDGSNSGAGKTLVEGTDYDIDIDKDATSGETLIRIIFKDMVNKLKNNVEDEIVITYSAILDEDAVYDTANENSVIVEYSNDPTKVPEYDPEDDDDPENNPDDPDDPGYPDDADPTGEGPENHTDTYATILTVNKYHMVDGEKEKLTGAEFTLTATDSVYNKVKVTGKNYVPYVTPADATATAPTAYYKLNDGTFTTAAPIWVDSDTQKANYTKYAGATAPAAGQTEGTIDKYMLEETEWYETKGETAKTVKGFVDENGVITFSGLVSGEYILTESIVPDGYNPINPITVTVDFVEGDDTEASYFYIKEQAKVKEGTTELDPDSLTMTIDVENNNGIELPETGGIGTTIFYVIGGILLVGAAVLLITKKRMAA